MPIDRLEAARRLRALDFSVIPVGADKRPATPWLMFQQARATDDNLVAWFGNGSALNVGIVTGRISNLVVVDTDDDRAEAWAQTHLPATPMMCKTAKGMHRYYRHPGHEVRNLARIDIDDGPLALDVRGDGGYVVAPGSTHPSGITYSAPAKWPTGLETVPVFSSQWLTQRPTTTVRPPGAPDTIPAGQRNATLTSAAGAMQRRGMSEPAILAALRVENESKCDPPLEERELASIVKSIGRYGPAAAPARPKFVLLNDVELVNRPAPSAVITDRVFSNALGVLYGPSGVGKTFVVLDLALSVATGRPWLGAPVERAGSVVYVAAEGGAGVQRRVAAWKTYHGFPLDQVVGFCTIPQAVNLMDPTEADGLIDQIRPLVPQLIVFDTLARSLVGGDENSAKDMGLLVSHCDRIRTALNTVVMLVHHSQKNGPAERGSSALRGACDTMLELSNNNDLLTLKCDKQKDAQPFPAINVNLHLVNDANSLIARLAGDDESTNLTTAERSAVAALRDSFTSEGASPVEWLKAAQGSERHFFRIKKRLVALGYVRQENKRFVWTGKEPEHG